ncbi:hypothetical protein P3T76_008223 [Phytophthora citrophthora]|uniref:Uncharacterized protein n=1 Tax=Phytophthora citrophthora TaxID=4793 RepID=A0AAD9GK23_9STRA|nr:hypothetical protein P3T76_008223 [Phytophthora citrophthora]
MRRHDLATRHSGRNSIARSISMLRFEDHMALFKKVDAIHAFVLKHEWLNVSIPDNDCPFGFDVSL